jgi:hypothetical protein
MSEKLRKDLCDFLSLDYETVLKDAKLEEAKLKNATFLHPVKYYRDKVLVIVTEKDLEDFQVEIEFCETREQHDMWEFYKLNTSSVKTNRNVGRNMRMLVKHKQSQKYIGIISLSSDIYSCESRDKYIGWDKDTHKNKLQYVMNISTCVGLQPISYNINIGKLLVAICFSQPVLQKFKEKYNHDIACITTFAINGKSVQYDRIPQYIKYIGETKGYALTNIPDKLYNSCIQFLKKVKDQKALEYKNKMYKLNRVINYLDINIENAHKRGIYIGFTSKDSKEFLQNKTDMFEPNIISLDDTCKWWKERWAKQRFQHLSKEGKLRYKVEFYNPLREMNKERVSKCITELKEKITDEEYRKKKREYMENYRNRDLGTLKSSILHKSSSIKSCMKDKLHETDHNMKNINWEWFAGFVDGDGSFNSTTDNYIRLEIYQCNPYPLFLIEANMGGNIIVRTNSGDNSRMIFNWALTGSKLQGIIEKISSNVILENDHLIYAIKHYNNKDNNENISIFKSKIKRYDDSLYSRISNAYIAGLFDAEGEVALRLHNDGRNSKYSLSITQKSNIELLHAIAKYLGYGNVNTVRLMIYNKSDIIDFLERVLPYLIVKRDQALTLLKFFDKRVNLEDAIQDIHNEKHRNYEEEIKKYIKKKDDRKLELLSKNKKKTEDKLVKEFKPDLKTDVEDNNQQENNKQNHEEKKRKERTYDHLLNMKIGIVLSVHSKRKVTDEQIIDIRKQHAEGKTFTEIAESYKLSRQYITNIAKGKIMTLEEINNVDNVIEALNNKIETTNKNIAMQNEHGVDSKTLGTAKTSMAKRKVPTRLILDVMKYKVNNMNTIPSYILRKFKEEDPDTKLTLDMVKNYTGGRIKLYELEFPVDTYTWEDYNEMLVALKK